MNEAPLYLRGVEACGRPGEGRALSKSEGLNDPAGGTTSQCSERNFERVGRVQNCSDYKASENLIETATVTAVLWGKRNET